jgi:DNA-binding IclR family transcriptional regulator
LERALKILDMIGHTRGGLSNREISEEMGIATSSCSYVLSRLERESYLERNATTGKYEIGLKVLAIARGALRQMKFREVAEPVLRKLSSDSGMDGVIGVLDQDQLMVISRVASGDFPNADVDTGTEFPAHSTAIGKVLLAACPEAQVLSLIEKKGLAKRAPKTITSTPVLLADLELVRKRGYSVSDEEHDPGMRSIGAPIVDSGGSVCAAVAIVGSSKRPVWSEMNELVELVKSAAREISRLIRLDERELLS